MSGEQETPEEFSNRQQSEQERYDAEREVDNLNSTSSSKRQKVRGEDRGDGGSEEELHLAAEEAAWEASSKLVAAKIQKEFEAEAQRVADKVQRQQEGRESAMLEQEHQDESFLSVDEIKHLLEEENEDKFDEKIKEHNMEEEVLNKEKDILFDEKGDYNTKENKLSELNKELEKARKLYEEMTKQNDAISSI